MSKIEQTLRREDGSEVKIVATEFFGAGLHRSVGVYVLARANANETWRLANSGALPVWADMSIQDSEKLDRSEMLQLVSRSEISHVLQKLDDVSEQPDRKSTRLNSSH